MQRTNRYVRAPGGDNATMQVTEMRNRYGAVPGPRKGTWRIHSIAMPSPMACDSGISCNRAMVLRRAWSCCFYRSERHRTDLSYPPCDSGVPNLLVPADSGSLSRRRHLRTSGERCCAAGLRSDCTIHHPAGPSLHRASRGTKWGSTCQRIPCPSSRLPTILALNIL